MYFGETHMHTSWSIDAFAISGSTYNGPEEAYRYARGETINHPNGYPIRITEPLDWIGVTEHAEYLGAFKLAVDPDSILQERHPYWTNAINIPLKANPLAAYMLLAKSIVNKRPIEALQDPVVIASVWKRIVEIADDYYKPGEFTTFPAYEWTAQPDNKNMHRNVFFRDSSKVPEVILDAIHSGDPWDLWMWMEEQRAQGNELLAIAHNGNLSDGLMYPTETDLAGRPIDSLWAEHRRRNEPLTEIKQGKGTSETMPLLSPNDEFADYEILDWKLLGATGASKIYGSYIRQAYRDGVALQGSKGFNPAKFGLMAGADTHNAAVGYRQDNWFGMHGSMDGDTAIRLSPKKQMNLDNRQLSPPGLSAVWADENTREGIFDGMKRRETYATSGVRIRLRFFGGWEFNNQMLDEKDWVAQAYDRGVPMGNDMPVRNGDAPTFVVHVMKDPGSAHLDRVQIVKGWSDRGQSFEKIYDVAWSGDREQDPATYRVGSVGSTVNFSDASYTNSIGSPVLKVIWTDPDFDPALDAFYYVRALEIPTPRWPLIEARAAGVAPPDGVSLVAQQRAWSSPIWYTPDSESRMEREEGITVDRLTGRGAEILNEDQLEALVVGNDVMVQNLVTGDRFDIFYGTDGRRLITQIGGENGPGAEMHTMATGTTDTYLIEGNKLLTTISGTVFEISVYRLGEQYFAARSNEFGHVNYEVTVSTE